jgi:hypothetical protein
MRRIERKIYTNTTGFLEYRSAAAAAKSRCAISFEFEGHRWAYIRTDFDDKGEYHLIYRNVARNQRDGYIFIIGEVLFLFGVAFIASLLAYILVGGVR